MTLICSKNVISDIRETWERIRQKLIFWPHGWEVCRGSWDIYGLFMVLVQDLCHTSALPWSQNFFLKFLFCERESEPQSGKEREKNEVWISLLCKHSDNYMWQLFIARIIISYLCLEYKTWLYGTLNEWQGSIQLMYLHTDVCETNTRYPEKYVI